MFKKIILVALLPAIAASVIAYKNFFFFRRGWHTAEIQHQLVFWIVRLLLAPLIVGFFLKFRQFFNKLSSLVLVQMAGLTIYTIIHWTISFILCRLPITAFDGRNRNLINIIKDESFVLNLLVYCFSFIIIYVWIYFENKKLLINKILGLEHSLATSEMKLSEIKSRTDPLLRKHSSLSIKNGHKKIVIPFEKIICLLSDGPYVKIVTDTGTHMMNSRLYEIQKKLPEMFLRVHRSHIINVAFIKESRSLLNGDQLLLLVNGIEIRASRTYKEDIKAFLPG